jgi:hypothetical protein
MPTGAENVRSCGQTSSDRHAQNGALSDAVENVFSGRRMKFFSAADASSDVRDHIKSSKTTMGPRACPRGLQRWRQLKNGFRRIFGAAKFSTFMVLAYLIELDA